MTARAERARRRSRGWMVAVGGAAALAVVVATLIWRSLAVPAPELPEELTAAELDALGERRVFFAHQSVGGNVLGGLAEVADEERIVATTVPGAVSAGTIAHASVGVNGDPQSKVDEFTAILDAGMADAVDVAVLKLCYTDITGASDPDAVFELYSEALEAVASRHPDVSVIAATVPLTTQRDLVSTVKTWLGRDDGLGDEHNAARDRFNQLVRQEYAATGRLFDIAAVETASAAPAAGPPSLHPAFAADSGHLNAAGARAAAVEFARVVAGHAAG
ncbi:hypothetical protein ACTU3I_13195 [Microbacterium sp. RD1]|uniref:hypothetical protein n=1 Tax=Microbacterium sp. RD1 TaxID=3457313 RepID=UPI003FA5F07E